MHKITIRDALRQSHVTRWGMVQTLRKQSLAEHSCNVAMIAAEIGHRLALPQVEIDRMVRLAITHDIAEVYTGDVATPLKQSMGNQYFIELDEMLTFAGLSICDCTEEQGKILKIADLIDALLFVQEYGHGEHADSVASRLWDALEQLGGVFALSVYVDALSGSFKVLSDIRP